MTRTIYRERITSTDPRCRRHIVHDSESRRYAHDTSRLTIATVEHLRTLPILDQGRAGACTADCGFGVLGTAPYSSTSCGAAIVRGFGSFDQPGAYRLYSAEETLDGDGPYPPNDQGSSGLTLAKVLRSIGAISGWTQTFSLEAALKALTEFPLAIGTYWYNSMFDPSPEGIVSVASSSGTAGGHEYEVIGYDAVRGLVKCANSWGTGWGVDGYFYMAAEDLGALLARQGDVTIFTPLDQPAPTPAPPAVDPADLALTTALDPWADMPHVGANHRAALSYLRWKAARGL